MTRPLACFGRRKPARPTITIDDPTQHILTPEADFQDIVRRSATNPGLNEMARPLHQKRLSTLLTPRASLSQVPSEEEEHVPINFKDDIYNPDPDQMANLLMTACMTRVGRPLPPEYSTVLLHVLEEYRVMKGKISQAREKLQFEESTRIIAQNKLDKQETNWAADREAFLEEIKRLELIISNGKNGMTALAKARAGSILGKDGRRRQEKPAKKDELSWAKNRDPLSTETALIKTEGENKFPEERDHKVSVLIHKHDRAALERPPIRNRPGPLANPRFVSYHRRQMAARKSPLHNELSSSADYEDIDDDESSDEHPGLTAPIDIPQESQSRPPSKAPISELTKPKTPKVTKPSVTKPSVTQQMGEAINQAIKRLEHSEAILAPYQDRIVGRSTNRSSKELNVGKQRSGFDASTSPTKGSAAQPKRIATSIRIEENKSSTQKAGKALQERNQGRTGLGHRREYSFRPGDDSEPGSLPFAVLGFDPLEHRNYDSLSSAACTISDSPPRDLLREVEPEARAKHKTSPPLETAARRSVSPDKNPLRLLGKAKTENQSPRVGPHRVTTQNSTINMRRLSAESTAETSLIFCRTGSRPKGPDASKPRAESPAMAAARAASGGNRTRERSPLSVAGNQGQQERGRQGPEE